MGSSGAAVLRIGGVHDAVDRTGAEGALVEARGALPATHFVPAGQEDHPPRRIQACGRGLAAWDQGQQF
jgi:hypothetical protein